jgi:hypothetical protein
MPCIYQTFDFKSSLSQSFNLASISPSQKYGFFWHVNCSHTFMARKLNPSKLRQSNAAAQMMNRKPAPPVAALYLMQLRAQGVKISSQGGTRLAVYDEIDEQAEQPVKIKKILK